MSQDEATQPSTPAASSPEPDPNAAALAKTATTINRKWSFKLIIIVAVSAFMAGFFLVDGLVRYPARGAEAAEYLEFQYLQAYDKERGGISGFTGIDDPQARLSQLAEKLRTTGKLDTVDDAQKVWLENLKLINQLSVAATGIPRTNFKDQQQVESATKRLETLTKTWTTGDGNNRTGWSNASYDALIAAAAAEPDTARRFECFRKAESILVVDEAAVCPLYFYVAIQFYDATRLGGLSQNLLDEHPLRFLHWKSP